VFCSIKTIIAKASAVSVNYLLYCFDVCFNIKYVFVRNVQLIHFDHYYSFIAHSSTMIISCYREAKMSELLDSNHNNLVVAVYENFGFLIYMFAEHSKSVSHNVFYGDIPTIDSYSGCFVFIFASAVLFAAQYKTF